MNVPIFSVGIILGNILLITVFVVIIKYLIRVYRLIVEIENYHSGLWIELGRPRFFPFWVNGRFDLNVNPFSTFVGQVRFLSWFLKAKPNFERTETNEILIETKSYLMYGLVGIALVWVSLGAIFSLMLVTMKSGN